MVSWSNWSGRQKSKPQDVHFIRSEDDAVAVASRASQARHSIRVAGAGHSHSPLVPDVSIIQPG